MPRDCWRKAVFFFLLLGLVSPGIVRYVVVPCISARCRGGQDEENIELSGSEEGAAGGQDERLSGWKPRLRFETPANWAIDFVAFSPDSRILAYNCWYAPWVRAGHLGGVRRSNRIISCDTSTGGELHRLSQEGDNRRPSKSAVFSPDGKLLAVAYEGDIIRIWSLDSGRAVGSFGDREGIGPVWIGGAMMFTPDGRNLVARMDDRRIPIGRDAGLYVWEVRSGRQVRRFVDGPLAGVRSIAIAKDSKSLLVEHLSDQRKVKPLQPELLHWQQSLEVWDLQRGRLVGVVAGPFECSNEPSSPHPPPGLTLREAGATNGFRVRQVAGRRVVLLPSYGLVPGVGLAIARDVFALVDAVTGQEIHRFREFEHGELQTAVLSADGNLLAAVGRPARPRQDDEGEPEDDAKDAARAEEAEPPYQLLVWDISKWNQRHRQPPAPSPARLERLWARLAGADGAKAHWAMREFAASPAASVAFLQKHLHPVRGEGAMPGLVKDLDNPDFQVRERAARALEDLGEMAEPSLRRALRDRPTLEARRRIEPLLKKLEGPLTPAQLQALRAIDVLEHVATPPGQNLLRQLAGGSPGSYVTQAARESLQRPSTKHGHAGKN